jgi:hypothetical protein
MMLAGVSGCLPEAFLAQSHPPTQIPCKIATRWDHYVHFEPDTENNGKRLPTIGGRFTLFAEDLTTPVTSEGTVIVYMYDDMPDATDKEEVLEAWIIDTATVHRLLRRDAAGWGYTLILPWQKYRPDLTHVRLQVRFDRVGGKSPLYSDLIPVTFEEPNGPSKVVITQKQTTSIMPGKGVTTQTTVPGNATTGNLPALNTVPGSQPALNAANGRQPLPNGNLPFVDQSNGGSLPTTITKSPAPIPGADVPFIVPKAGTNFPVGQ